jgi:Protein of unknown function (DUF3551)
MKINAGFLVAAAALAAAMLSGAPASQAGSFGEAPWCAVINMGTGTVVWDCEYQSIEQCQPEVLAGNRGFCNPNPRWTPPAYGAPPRHRHKHHSG